MQNRVLGNYDGFSRKRLLHVAAGINRGDKDGTVAVQINFRLTGAFSACTLRQPSCEPRCIITDKRENNQQHRGNIKIDGVVENLHTLGLKGRVQQRHHAAEAKRQRKQYCDAADEIFRSAKAEGTEDNSCRDAEVKQQVQPEGKSGQQGAQAAQSADSGAQHHPPQLRADAEQLLCSEQQEEVHKQVYRYQHVNIDRFHSSHHRIDYRI